MTGDKQNTFGRLKSLIPRWFGDDTPILDALLRGLAYTASFIYDMASYARLQSRIKTATDGWLDMIAADFFGDWLMRKAGQSDASFRNRIIINLFRERATRAGLVKVLTDLTGRAPVIFEPQRPADTGAIGVNLALGVSGGIGSMLLPFQAFVTVYRPASSGIPDIAGLATPRFGLGVANGKAVLPSLEQIQGAVTDADIFDAVESVKPVGTTIWTRITN